MDRRSFLRGLLAVAAAQTLPFPPMLIGDGLADDTAALQAMIDKAAENGGVVFLRGVYRISSPLILRSGVGLNGGSLPGSGTRPH